MLDRIVHRLAGNVIKMRGHCVVDESVLARNIGSAAYREQILHFAAHCCSADISPCASETTGNKPRASSRVLLIASFTSFTIFAASPASGRPFP